MIVSSIANPFYPEFALAVEQAVRKHGYFLLVCNTNDDLAQERAYLDAVGGALARGVLVMNADFVQQDDLLALRRRGVPMVLCMWEQPVQPPALPCVAADFHRAGVIAAEHLLKLGHQRMGAVVGSEPSGNHIWRYLGFKDTLQRHGIPHGPGEVRFGRDTIDAGRNAAHALLAAVPDLTAIFVSNDLPAIGVLQAAADLGLNVPADLSVTGITDIQLAHPVRPALTTVAVPTGQAAAGGARLHRPRAGARHAVRGSHRLTAHGARRHARTAARIQRDSACCCATSVKDLARTSIRGIVAGVRSSPTPFARTSRMRDNPHPPIRES
jgi:DNA-binding LacI/PurR family transcriptional regulator